MLLRWGSLGQIKNTVEIKCGTYKPRGPHKFVVAYKLPVTLCDTRPDALNIWVDLALALRPRLINLGNPVREFIIKPSLA